MKTVYSNIEQHCKQNKFSFEAMPHTKWDKKCGHAVLDFVAQNSVVPILVINSVIIIVVVLWLSYSNLLSSYHPAFRQCLPVSIPL